MCTAPATVKGIPLKCGQCMECRLAYSREWAIRMSHEQACHDASCFLTLTYSDEFLPRFGQLEMRDLTLFFKRLRKSFGPFRYVACGEYGELHRRPHFHAAIFGLDFRSDRLLRGQGIQGDELFESPSLSRVWTYGNHKIGELTFESAAYIARYVTKKIKGIYANPLPLACNPETGELVFPNPEKLVMSRRPGIGYTWFKRYFNTDVLPHGRVITAQGTPAPVPRFYKDKIEDKEDKLKLQWLTLSHYYDSLQSRNYENKPERRSARAAYANSKNSIFKRDTNGG